MHLTVAILALTLVVLVWVLTLSIWGIWQAIAHVWKDSKRQNSSRALWEERGKGTRR